jgi:beta-lactam-binding protein with PASTA domain
VSDAVSYGRPDLSNEPSDTIFNTSSPWTPLEPEVTQVFTPLSRQGYSQPQGDYPAQQRDYQDYREPQQQYYQDYPAQQQRPIAYSQPPSPPPERKGKKIRPLVVALLALLAILTLVIALMSDAFNFNKENDKIVMPDLMSGYTVESATSLLLGLGLEVETQSQYDPSPEGTVIDQSVQEGRRVKKGDKVTITISLGPNETMSAAPIEEVTVPSLVGKSFDQAFYELTQLGLTAQRGEDQYSDLQEGVIISQNPESGTRARKGDMILIIVSKGAAPFSITVTAGSGGSVTPHGSVAVAKGDSLTLSITPDEGYEIREIKVDGKNVDVGTQYTFENVQTNHTFYVVFQPVPESPSPSVEPSGPVDSSPPNPTD